MPSQPKPAKRTALKIALAYFVTAVLWIILSDKLLLLLTDSAEQALFLQTYKGWAFVALTALLLYLLVLRGLLRLQRAFREERSARRKLSQAMESANLAYFVYHPQQKRLVLETPSGQNGLDTWATRETTLHELVHPEDLPQVLDLLQEHLEGRSERFETEHRIAHPRDGYRWALARGRVTEAAGAPGAAPIVTGTLMDIDERKSMERTILESRRELANLADAIPDYIARFDTDFRHIFVNKALCDLAGIPREEYLGKTNDELGMPPHLLELWNPLLQEVLQLGEERVVQFEFPVQGEERTMHCRLTPELDEQDTVVGLIGVTRDITELKLTHQVLLESEKRLNDAQRIAHVASYERNLVTNKGFWSDELYRMLGYAPGEKENSLELFLSHVHPEDRQMVRDIFLDAIQRRSEFAAEFRYVRTNKQLRHGFLNGRISRDEDGAAVFYQGILQDISERKRAAEEYALLVTAIEQASEGVLITDAQGVLQYVNPAFEQTAGYRRHEVLGHTPRILKSGHHDEAFYTDLWQTISQGLVWRGRIVNRRKDGSLYEAETTVSPVRNSSGVITNYVALGRDVTERTKLERQLRQAQKMEAIGTLAGGVAHDFNNILAAIMGFAEIALMEIPEEQESVRDSLRDILTGSRRGSELVRNILTFSRQGAQDKVPVEIQPLAKEALKLIRASLPASVAIQERLELERAVILADPTEMQQLLLNLLANAGQAMATTGGVLDVSLVPHEPDLEELAKHPSLSPGPHMLLRVADSGPGIAPEILDRIFDPFFTTKTTGEGTGLGLSIVHGIVESHGGVVDVESAPGKGATFSVLLPLSSQQTDVEEMHTPLTQGHQRILLAEDESAVARSLERLLSLLGYEVHCHAGGQEALEHFQNDPDAFDLLFTDQMMPGMHGLELARRIKDMRPELPVILATGYGVEELAEQARQVGVFRLLSKPIDMHTLSMAVHAALTTRGEEGAPPAGETTEN